MLVYFKASNFLSFGDNSEFSMIAADDISRKNERVVKYKKLKTLKNSVLYGANGAGKSNLIKAIQFLKSSVVDNQNITIENFHNYYNKLDEFGMSKPIEFTIVVLMKNKLYKYEYGFDKELKINEKFCLIDGNNEDQIIYIRKFGENVLIENKVNKVLTSYSKSNKLIIEFTFLNNDIEDFHKYISLLNIENSKSTFPQSLPKIVNGNNNKMFEKFNDFLCKTNTGIDKVELKVENIEKFYSSERDIKLVNKIKDEIEINLNEEYIMKVDDKNDFIYFKKIYEEIYVYWIEIYHKNSNKEYVLFDKKMESDGTQRIIDMLPTLLEVLYAETVVFIDEIENSIHPSLLKEFIIKLLELPIKGQIIFTTHESHLLDQNIFRQDEIKFVEKNESGYSEFYKLSDFDIRNELDIKKGYFSGRFGGVPILANLRDLNWSTDDKK